jgi:phospholipase/carboxylesterase
MHAYKIVEQGTSPENAKKALILIHGRGAPPEDILSLTRFFNTENTYVAAPEATYYTWYPYSFLSPVQENQPWLNSAISNIEKLISNIEKQIPKSNIYIMGFSQGACLTAEVTTRNAAKYGGIAVFTGGLIGKQIDQSNYKGNFDGTKVYISNGDYDPHIPLDRSETTERIMTEKGADVLMEIFPGRAHTISMKEIEMVKDLFELG